MKIYIIIISISFVCCILSFILGRLIQRGKEKGWLFDKMIRVVESYKKDGNLWFSKDGLIYAQNIEGLFRYADVRRTHFEFVDVKGSVYFPNEAILDRDGERIILFDTHADTYAGNGVPFEKSKLEEAH